MRITNEELRKRIKKLLLRESKLLKESVLTSNLVANQARINNFVGLRTDTNNNGVTRNLSTRALAGQTLSTAELARNTRIMNAIPGASTASALFQNVNIVDANHLADAEMSKELASELNFGKSTGDVGEHLVGLIALAANSSGAGNQLSTAARGKASYTNLNSELICAGQTSGALGIQTLNFIGLGKDQFPAFDVMYHDGQSGTGLSTLSIDSSVIKLPALASAKFSGSAKRNKSSAGAYTNATANRQPHTVGQMRDRGDKKANNLKGIKGGMLALCLASIYNTSSPLAVATVPATSGSYVGMTFQQAVQDAHNPADNKNSQLRFGKAAAALNSICQFFIDCGVTAIEAEGIDGYNVSIVPYLDHIETNLSKVGSEPVYFCVASPQDASSLMTPTTLTLSPDFRAIVPTNANTLHELGGTQMGTVLAMLQFGKVSDVAQYPEAGLEVLQREQSAAAFAVDGALKRLNEINEGVVNLEYDTSFTGGTFDETLMAANYARWIDSIYPGSNSLRDRRVGRQVRTDTKNRIDKRVKELSMVKIAGDAIAAALGRISADEFDQIMDKTNQQFRITRNKFGEALRTIGSTPTLKSLGAGTSFLRQLNINTYIDTLEGLRSLVYAVHFFDKDVGSLIANIEEFDDHRYIANVRTAPRTEGGSHGGINPIVDQLIDIHNSLLDALAELQTAGIMTSKELKAIRTTSSASDVSNGLSNVGRSIDSGTGKLHENQEVMSLDSASNDILTTLLQDAMDSLTAACNELKNGCELLSDSLIEAAGVIEAHTDDQYLSRIFTEIDRIYEEELSVETPANIQQELDPNLQKILDVGDKKSYYDMPNMDMAAIANPIPSMQNPTLSKQPQMAAAMEESRIYENILKKILYTAKKRR